MLLMLLFFLLVSKYSITINTICLYSYIKQSIDIYSDAIANLVYEPKWNSNFTKLNEILLANI